MLMLCNLKRKHKSVALCGVMVGSVLVLVRCGAVCGGYNSFLYSKLQRRNGLSYSMVFRSITGI